MWLGVSMHLALCRAFQIAFMLDCACWLPLLLCCACQLLSSRLRLLYASKGACQPLSVHIDIMLLCHELRMSTQKFRGNLWNSSRTLSIKSRCSNIVLSLCLFRSHVISLSAADQQMVCSLFAPDMHSQLSLTRKNDLATTIDTTESSRHQTTLSSRHHTNQSKILRF